MSQWGKPYKPIMGIPVTWGMSIGTRIESRLKELGISQAELARRVMVDQSTINGLVRGHSQSSKHLHRIARELQTTAAYLSGETDDPQAEAPVPQLDHAERELLDLFRQLAGDERTAVSLIVRRLVDSAAPQNVPDYPIKATVRDRRRTSTVHDEPHTYRARA